MKPIKSRGLNIALLVVGAVLALVAVGVVVGTLWMSSVLEPVEPTTITWCVVLLTLGLWCGLGGWKNLRSQGMRLRVRWKRLLPTAAGAYFALWALTYLFGRASVCAAADRSYPSDWHRATDPTQESLESQVPYVFVGHAWSPAPFVVSVQYRWVVAPSAAAGGRKYFIWFGVWRKEVADVQRWIS